jgi:hypothetical protein
MLAVPQDGFSFQDAIYWQKIPISGSVLPFVQMELYWTFSASAHFIGFSIENYPNGTDRYERRVEYITNGTNTWRQVTGSGGASSTTLGTESIPSLSQGLGGQPVAGNGNQSTPQWNYFSLTVDLSQTTSSGSMNSNGTVFNLSSAPTIYTAASSGQDKNWVRFEIHVGSTSSGSLGYYYIGAPLVLRVT